MIEWERIPARVAYMALAVTLGITAMSPLVAQQRHAAAAPAAQAPRTTAKPAANTGPRPAARPGTDSSRAIGKTITIDREVFQYSPAGRRDPFSSLLQTSDIRPVLADLRLTSVAYDPRGSNSVVILRDIGTKEQYRGKVGSQIGRMRITRIDTRSVTFNIEEFGFSRQETLSLGDSTSTRTQ